MAPPSSNVVFFASFILGCITISKVMNTDGRIRGFQFGIFWHIGDSVIQIASVNHGVFLVGYSFTGMGVGFSAVTGPIYLMEFAPSLSLGLMASMHRSCQNTGYFFSTTFTAGQHDLAPAESSMPGVQGHNGRYYGGPDLTRLHQDKRDRDISFMQKEYREILGQPVLGKEARGFMSNDRLLLTNCTDFIRILLVILVTTGIINIGVLVINGM
ncbi:uncharacterized protein A1O5_01343 [Cladophialophora psammophila CBS 110553]|uniref:Major facilitator superfamily (MFS) profile domain-containing protein n=1 Tax=Cladophialophora psammophila CBS 110553 TaxID=1182543 RepID=W9XBE5_9EURO|nr:uncharacterized protein A1O5_01343 [Cladophialophora psammophila CBS 110553]EXJ74650.1 hypothetical protein A1O5_01343 [Cladophialophora psammophila CBS 110553]